MNTNEIYQVARKRKNSNPLVALLRKISFFLNKPFFREIIEDYPKLVKKGDAHITKKFAESVLRIKSFEGKLREARSRVEVVSNEHRSQFKDFDAVLQRLNFIEQNLQQQEHFIKQNSQQLDERIAGIRDSLGPVAELSLGGSITSVELKKSALSISHGRYGDFLLRNPDVVGDRIRMGEFWDEHLHDLIIRYSDKNGIAVDAGAYIGFHSVFLAKYFSKVVSFEPQAAVFKMLAANLVLNNVNNVEIHNAALYDRECRLKIASQDKQECPLPMKDGHPDYPQVSNAASITFELADTDAGSVQSYPLDSLRLDHVRFIKIDTQGSDLRVLWGAKETIERCKPVVVFEYEVRLSAAHGSQKSDYEKFFADIGYGLELLHSHEDKQFDFLALPLS